MSPQVRELLQKAIAEGIAKEVEGLRVLQTPYLAPSDEPFGWDQKGVITLDALILAMHVTTARVALRAVPEVLRQVLKAAESSADRYFARKAAMLAAGEAATFIFRRVLFFIAEFYTVWQQSKMEAEMEAVIRNVSMRGRREMLRLRKKPKANRVRRTKRIASRNPRRSRVSGR